MNVLAALQRVKTWMARTRPAMTAFLFRFEEIDHEAAHSVRRLSRRKMADAIQHMASIPASEILLLSVCRAGQRDAIGSALDHESRDRNGLCRHCAPVEIPIARVLPRLAPANRVGMHGYLRPIRIFERFGSGLEFGLLEPALR